MLPPRHHKAARKLLWIYWPRRILSERGLAVVLLLASVILAIFSLVAPDVAHDTRMTVFDKTRGVFQTLSKPAQKATTMIEHMAGLSNMSSDLARLREENANLRQWYDRALQLEAENRSLRNLVHLASLPRVSYVSARIIAESGNGFSQSVVVDAGATDGVKPKSVAMTGEGVIGRVMTANDHTSQVILLTDVNTRIPVIIENSRHRGVLAGDNSAQPQLLYLPDDAAVNIGERVLTSGHGGVFAPGLPVGVIVSTTQGIRVQPFADLRRLDFMQLIYFGRDGTAESTPEASQKATADE